jgi:hypothetical protein
MLAGKKIDDPGLNLTQGRGPRSSDEAAAAIGVSRITAERGIAVVEEIDRAMNAGDVARQKRPSPRRG